MCGIAGIISNNQDDISEHLAAMTERVAHRGPDASAFFYDTHIGLGHRRLAILDLRPEGVQPMTYRERYTIVFNGEIYNYKELKKELEQQGYTFSTETDTEVILAAYDLYKEACVERFNGMWAFAIYDAQMKQVFCSRDRYGIKPFYYYSTSELFAFGSEIRQLLPFLSNVNANKKIVLDFLLHGKENDTPETFFEDITQLMGGQTLLFDIPSGKKTINTWYHIESGIHSPTDPKDFSTLLEDAIHLCLRSDVPVGGCLSGGLDSSTVCSIAASLYTGKDTFHTIHAQSISPQHDESAYAQAVATHCGVPLHVTSPSIEEILRALPTVVRIQEEPFASPSIIMQYFVMQKAKALGCTVMLDGQGGDELLLGYDRYIVPYLHSLPYRQYPNAIRNIQKHTGLSLLTIILYWCYFSFPRYQQLRRLRRLPDIEPTLRHKINKKTKKSVSLFSLQQQELSHQLPHLLRYEDKNAMHFGIETRLPLLDYRLVEHAINLPIQEKIHDGWTKYILRKTMDKRLPKNIVWRTNKKGFEAPIDLLYADQSYIDGSTELIQQSVLLDSLFSEPISSHIRITSPQVWWKLYSVALWEKTFLSKDH